jgi:hypothetical protein
MDMRGREKYQSSMLCLASPEQFIPKGLPVRETRAWRTRFWSTCIPCSTACMPAADARRFHPRRS